MNYEALLILLLHQLLYTYWSWSCEFHYEYCNPIVSSWLVSRHQREDVNKKGGERMVL